MHDAPIINLRHKSDQMRASLDSRMNKFNSSQPISGGPLMMDFSPVTEMNSATFNNSRTTSQDRKRTVNDYVDKLQRADSCMESLR